MADDDDWDTDEPSEADKEAERKAQQEAMQKAKKGGLGAVRGKAAETQKTTALGIGKGGIKARQAEIEQQKAETARREKELAAEQKSRPPPSPAEVVPTPAAGKPPPSPPKLPIKGATKPTQAPAKPPAAIVEPAKPSAEVAAIRAKVGKAQEEDSLQSILASKLGAIREVMKDEDEEVVKAPKQAPTSVAPSAPPAPSKQAAQESPAAAAAAAAAASVPEASSSSSSLVRSDEEPRKPQRYLPSRPPVEAPTQRTSIGLAINELDALIRSNENYATQKNANMRNTMESMHYAAKFLASPETMDLKSLFEHTQPKNVWGWGESYRGKSQKKAEQLQMRFMQLGQNMALNPDKTPMDNAENLNAFFAQINKDMAQNPYLKAMILKGYLDTAQAKWGGEKQNYKIGALCQNLKDLIDVTALAKMPPSQQDNAKKLRDKGECKAAFEKYKKGYNENFAKDAKAPKKPSP